MDLETENQIAAILMKEAAELRRQAEKEGVQAYLRQPKVRGRPNSRFLTATVLGVQQSNRAVEVDEMWRVRQKELELDDKLKGGSRDENSNRSHRDHSGSLKSMSMRRETDKTAAALCSSSKRGIEECHSSEDGGLRDEDVEEFLHSRVKRGRGAVGSRMDETGPYLPPSCSDFKGKLLANPNVRVREDWEHCVLGPERPPSLKSRKSSEDESDQGSSWRKAKKVESVSSKKRHSKKHKSEEDKSQDKKKKKTSKHRHKSR